MSRKGLTQAEKIAIGVGAVIILAILIPVYLTLLDIRHTNACQNNLGQISKAFQYYVLDNGGSLPLAQFDGTDGPALDSKGRPVTWMHSINAYLRKDIEQVAVCPADPLGGSCVLTHPSDSSRELRSSYGMVAALSGREVASLPAGGSALIVESVSGGQWGTRNHRPLVGGNDGFLLDYAEDFVSRAAVSRIDEKTGWDENNMRSFHGRGLNILYADGHVSAQKPSIANLSRDAKGDPLPPWAPRLKAEDR
ncbi:MAG: hypothetical protein HUU60_03580 [Armatimonadetes bacterium]|nr:hypothetical protein [Armatimonadota bacterium]